MKWRPEFSSGIDSNVLSTGSTTDRTMEDRFADIVNVLDYGATGDGVTDDLAAFDAAFVAASTVFVPESATSYIISDILNIPDNARLFGAGYNSLIEYTGSGVAMTTSATGLRINIDNIRLLTTSGTHGFRIQGTGSLIRILDLTVEGFTTAGVFLTGSANNISLIHCLLTNCGASGTDLSGGLFSNAAGGNNVVLLGTRCTNNNGWGIRVSDTSRGWAILGCLIEGNTLGGLKGGAFTGLSINGTYFENTAAGVQQIFINKPGSLRSSGVDIRGNFFTGAAASDTLTLQGIDGLVVEANHVNYDARYFVDASSSDDITDYRVAKNAFASAFTGDIFFDNVDGNNASVITDVAETYSAGTGDGTFVLSGRFDRGITAVGTDADTNEKILQTVTVPANTLSVNGQMIRITAWGTTAVNGNTKTIRFRIGGIGGTEITNTNGAFNNQNWRIEAVIARTGAATEDGTSVSYVGTSIIANDFTTHTISLTADTTIVVTGQNGTGTANDIVCEGFLAEYVR